MGYKNLLVQLDTTRACEKRVTAALDLAQRFDAHLVGLYVSPEPGLPVFMEAHLSEDLRRLQRETRQQRADRVIGDFEEAARLAGIGVESRVVPAPLDAIPDVLALHGRYSDLLILGQHDPDDDEALPPSLVQDTILGLGRPAILIPYIGAPQGFGRRIMLAWDGGREAALAATEALPLMRKAELVRVLSVNPKRGIAGQGTSPGSDVAVSLARHGINVEAQHAVSDDLEVADVLLSRAADYGVDLIVLGAYAHSRLRDIVLGGVTRTLLRHMTVPLLMAH